MGFQEHAWSSPPTNHIWVCVAGPYLGGGQGGAVTPPDVKRKFFSPSAATGANYFFPP